MVNNIVGVIVSFIYFFGLLILAQRLTFLSLEGRRKFVHILLGNWWIMLICLFTDVVFASVVPVSFIFINYNSLKRNKAGGLLAELERKDGQKSYGIVLYPVAIEILVLISFALFNDIRIGGIGLIVLAYGDGMAAVFGKHYNFISFKIWGNTKSISGSVAMFAWSLFPLAVYLYLTYSMSFSISICQAAIVALVSTIVELVSPFGTDDLMIPVAAVLTFYLLNYL